MKGYLKIIIPAGIIAVLGLIFYPRYHKWAREHVNYITATDDHPLKCSSCHLYIIKSGPVARIVNAKYYSPLNLAVSKDGKSIFAVAEDGNSLLVIDNDRKKVTEEIPVGIHPHSVIIDKSGNKAYVSNQWSDNVSVIDLKNYEVTDTLKTGGGPAGLALSSDEKFLYSVNSFSSDISVIDLSTGEEIKRLTAGNNPTGIGKSHDGSLLYVTSRRTLSAPYGDTIRCELTGINDLNQRISERRDIKSAYMMENVEFTPSGDLAIIPLIRPKNNVPTVQVERGWMMTEGIGIVENKPSGRTIQLLLDEPNTYYADPFDIAISPDGKKAFVSHSGVDKITVVDLDAVRRLISGITDDKLEMYANHLGISSRIVIKRISTGANPKGMSLSPDGKTLYVAEHLEDRIAVINTETLESEGTIHLGGSGRITVARHGRRLLNNAGGTFQTQYSCYTCHPDAHEDGLTYNMASKDMGRNMTNTQSLRNIGDTPPYKWNGKNQSVYKQDGMRFSTVLTRTEAFSYKDLDALTAYIMTGIPNPPNLMYNPDGELTEAQKRGKEIFERTHDNKGNEIPVTNRCNTCHPAPYYTNMKPAGVGTLAATDDSILFDTPHLNNIFASPPYLHDGRAATLEEIWTIYGKTEEHGSLNDLTKIQLNELVEYLKSLRDPEYENKKETKIHQASFLHRKK
ncbi:MAG TPA: beta-propeller fold lactonase family protein [Bacteroidales bacterium]|jgi:YVTN family beta-propeller protein|nr:beta-propeller fold lactonase family protein [Bacteroidales bacterium]